MQFQLLVGCKILRTNVTFGWIIMNINMVIEVTLKVFLQRMHSNLSVKCSVIHSVKEDND